MDNAESLLTRRRSSRRALRCFQSQSGHCCSRTSPRMASTLGRRRPSSSTSARWHACEQDDVFRNAVGFVGPESSRTSFGNIQIRMASNRTSGAGEAPRVRASAAVGVASGATRMRLPTRRRSLMPARAKAARKASLPKASLARRAASQATSASVTEKVTQMRSLPRRRRRTT